MFDKLKKFLNRPVNDFVPSKQIVKNGLEGKAFEPRSEILFDIEMFIRRCTRKLLRPVNLIGLLMFFVILNVGRQVLTQVDISLQQENVTSNGVEYLSSMSSMFGNTSNVLFLGFILLIPIFIMFNMRWRF